MAKELDKYKKEFTSIEKVVDDLTGEYANHETNAKHHKDMLLEAAKEIGRTTQTLIDAGSVTAISKYDDVVKAAKSESDLKAITDAVEDWLAGLEKEDTRVQTIYKAGKSQLGVITDFRKRLQKEVDSRNKKKSRAVAKVDSASLPELEDLLAESFAPLTALRDDLVTRIESDKWSFVKEKKNFEGWVKDELGKTKARRDDETQKELDLRAFDMRLIEKARKSSVTAAKDADKACKNALKLVKQKKYDDAEKEMTSVEGLLNDVKKHLEPYEREMKTKNAYDIKGMEHSDDGKKILAAIEEMRAAAEKIDDLHTKTSKKVK